MELYSKIETELHKSLGEEIKNFRYLEKPYGYEVAFQVFVKTPPFSAEALKKASGIRKVVEELINRIFSGLVKGPIMILPKLHTIGEKAGFYEFEIAAMKKPVSIIEDQITLIEDAITAQVAEASSESVEIEGWGTFYRRDDGWHGPGGFYGPSTPMAQKCEEASRLKREGEK